MMSMKDKLLALSEELLRLKRSGEETIHVSDETLHRFKRYFQRGGAPEVPVALADVIKKETPKPKVVVKVVPAGHEESKVPEPFPLELPDGTKEERWKWLQNKVLECPVCNEHVKQGMKIVYGVGNLDAEIFYCGEAPGAEEERVGQPFVGPAGELLNKIIGAMGIKREQVYIGNIMNWRPETNTAFGNRPPNAAEINFCLPYLKAQIEIVQPKVIVGLGATAANGLLGIDPHRRLKDVRGLWQEYEGIPLMITYHPSYVLKNGTKRTKRTIWEDMLQVMERVNLPISEKQRAYFS
jgi:DNA polymerase